MIRSAPKRLSRRNLEKECRFLGEDSRNRGLAKEADRGPTVVALGMAGPGVRRTGPQQGGELGESSSFTSIKDCTLKPSLTPARGRTETLATLDSREPPRDAPGRPTLRWFFSSRSASGVVIPWVLRTFLIDSRGVPTYHHATARRMESALTDSNASSPALLPR
jgi:hypothetical protein